MIIGALIFMATSYFSEPAFIISNKTHENVSLTARWRYKEIEIGNLAPGDYMEYKVSDEAAMQFIATFNDGKTIKNNPIYFTSGTLINIEILDNEITANYE